MNDLAWILTIGFLAIVWLGLKDSRRNSHQTPNRGKKHSGQKSNPFNQRKKDGQRPPMPPFSREHGQKMLSLQQRPLQNDDDDEDGLDFQEFIRRNSSMRRDFRNRGGYDEVNND